VAATARYAATRQLQVLQPEPKHRGGLQQERRLAIPAAAVEAAAQELERLQDQPPGLGNVLCRGWMRWLGCG